MRKYFAYSLLVAVLFGNSGAGCGSNNADDPQPAKFQSLLGKWQLQRASFDGTLLSGKTNTHNIDINKNRADLNYEFFSDGRLRLTGPEPLGGSRDVRWELSVEQLDPNGDINEGKLKIIGNEERELAQTLGQSGDLTYHISTIGPSSGGNFSKMYLEIDATKLEADRYQKIIMTYTYHKL